MSEDEIREYLIGKNIKSDSNEIQTYLYLNGYTKIESVPDNGLITADWRTERARLYYDSSTLTYDIIDVTFG